jgi:hypothetical protein
MKQTVFSIFVYLIFLVANLYFVKVSAQITESFSYQAILSDSKGTPIVGKVGVKVSILFKQENGTTVYMERHDKTTDSRGFIGLMIGEGTTIYLGKLDTINWANGPYFVKVEVSPTGGYSFPLITVSKIISVPYALFAQRADSLSSSFKETDPLFLASAAKKITDQDISRWNTLTQKAQYKIGQLAHGGIVFYVSPDGNHGLVAALNDFNSNTNWSNAKNLSLASYNDWYVPSINELHLLFQSQYVINKVLENGNGSTGLTSEIYWSSTEKNSNEAYIVEMGTVKSNIKTNIAAFRIIRSF